MDTSDYTDPICPFDLSEWQKEASVESVPMDRIIAKEDEYLGKNDYAGAERHLLYWLGDAKAGNDFRGAFQIENELMGLYRKSGKEKEARAHAETALQMARDPRIGAESTGAATAYINAATVYKTFDRADEGIALFEKARKIYERDLPAGDARLGGLYNNMALALTTPGWSMKRGKRRRKTIPTPASWCRLKPTARLTLIWTVPGRFSMRKAFRATAIMPLSVKNVRLPMIITGARNRRRSFGNAPKRSTKKTGKVCEDIRAVYQERGSSLKGLELSRKF